MIITNTSKGSIGLLRGITLIPGESHECKANDPIFSNPIICRWIDKGILSVSESAPVVVPEIEAPEEPEQPEPPVVEPDEQDTLLAELAAMGIKRDRRTSVEKLRRLLAEADK